MKWILDDLSRAFAQLKLWQTWLVIGLLGVFFGLAYLIVRFAFRTDAVLLFLNRTAGACREMTNGMIAFMFCGMIFFAFSAVLTLGEFQQYFEYRQRAAHFQARQSLQWGVGWAVVAIAIAITALVFFNHFCR